MNSVQVSGICGVVLVLAGFLFVSPARADRIEFVTGAKVEGEITARDDQSVTARIVISGQTFTRKYPLSRIRAIETAKGREVLSAQEGDPAKPAAEKARSTTGTKSAATAAGRDVSQRARAEVLALIENQGRAKPDWWDTVPLDYPKTLDLSFPQPPPPGWNNQRNVGQWIWDIVNPNPGKWRQGVRFMHHLLEVNKDNPATRRRVMNTLGRLYFALLQDYPRAAFWWRLAGVGKDDAFPNGDQLAECYWRLGNKQMALEYLNGSSPRFSTIKLLADMGETQRALKLAEASVGNGYDELVYLYAGDACRIAGRHREALKFYERAVRAGSTGQSNPRADRARERAQANLEAIKLFDLLELARVPDGVYRASSLGYEAPVQVEVTVKAGRIEDVRVTDHHEKQFYSAITDTCGKIVAKQGVKGIDTTSSATITSDAIINATAKALSGAMKP